MFQEMQFYTNYAENRKILMLHKINWLYIY